MRLPHLHLWHLGLAIAVLSIPMAFPEYILPSLSLLLGMTLSACVAVLPTRRWSMLRFRIRTLMIVVALAGVILTAGLWWLRIQNLHIHDIYSTFGPSR